MPRVSGNTHIGHFQERFTYNPRNLDTVAVLRFHVRDESLQRGAQRLLPIKSEDGGLDLPSHEEEGPSCFLNSLLERGTSVLDRCPSTRIRLALEQEGLRQMRASLNQDAPRSDCVCHGASVLRTGDRLRGMSQPNHRIVFRPHVLHIAPGE